MAGGIGLTMDIARHALASAQQGLSVSGNNVANVSTPSYSKQNARQVTTLPLKLGRIQLGTGVKVDSVKRATDKLLERRIMYETSTKKAYEEGSSYMSILATFFNENAENSISKTIADFWNTWHDLSNHPAGSAERTAVHEFGMLMTEELNALDTDLKTLSNDLTSEIWGSITEINAIAKSIAAMNKEIASVEVSANANDQRDKRNRLMKSLSELVDIQTFEQDNGEVTIIMSKGAQLVNGPDHNLLNLRDGNVYWKAANDNAEIDITDRVKGGKIGGWLEQRDEVVKKYSNDLKSLTNGLVWEVNYQHSQGVGLDFFATPLTGSYSTHTSGRFDTLPFGDKIDYEKDFKMWVKKSDAIDPLATSRSIVVDMAVSDSKIEAPVYPGKSDASTKYTFTVEKAGTIGGSGFNFPEVNWKKTNMITGEVEVGLAPLPITNGEGNLNVEGISMTIKPGYLVAGNTFSINTDENGAPDLLDIRVKPTIVANSVSDTYVFTVKADSGGVIGRDDIEILWKNSTTNGVVKLDPEESPVMFVDGLQVDFGEQGTVFEGDTFTITTNEKGEGKVNLEDDWHWTIESFADEFNKKSGDSGIVATAIEEKTKIRFSPREGFSFAFSDEDSEDSGTSAALGLNTFFSGDDAGSVKLNDAIGDLNKIAVARIDGGSSKGIISDTKVKFPIIINSENDIIEFQEDDGTGIIDNIRASLSPGTYVTEADLHTLAKDVELSIEAASQRRGHGIEYKVIYDNKKKKFIIKEDGGSKLKEIRIIWAKSSAAPKLGFDFLEDSYLPPNGDYGLGNNKNALILADLQFEKQRLPVWTFIRGQEAFSESMEASTEGYYQGLIGSMGTKASSIERGLEFSSAMVEKLNEQRDALSGVSLDEEMTNMMKYQQSYTAASKLLKTSDEMLQTILSIK
ncbi:MAG: flagellar hook-associated protein FlgK [Desulfobacterales bacterium]|nr:flagellar hook-associated protein FlgK [Desulfobacterales bacterium]